MNMNPFLSAAWVVTWLVILMVAWLGWQLLRQNGRLLLRIEEMEKRLHELEFDESEQPRGLAMENGDGRADRFRERSLARSRIKRDGLKAGTVAPEFRLPRLDGRGELSLSQLRGRPVLLVFSSPECGPCNALAPHLQKFHRAHPEVEVVMISKGEARENRAKVKEHGLSFPIVLQQQWEISRLYGMFATPIAYLIGEDGMILHDIAVGTNGILTMLESQSGGLGVDRNLIEVRD
jgi:peroxiredoxin